MQNFDPSTLTASLSDLAIRVGNLEKAITGKGAANIEDGVDCVDDVANIVGDFVPQVREILTIIQPLIPIIPVLVDKFSGEAAGAGAAQVSATVLPAEQLGIYHPENGTVTPPKGN